MANNARRRRTSDVAALSANRREDIVRDRARRLAVLGEAAAPSATAQRVLLCLVGANLYGLPLDQVEKVKPFTTAGAAVGVHPAMLGLVADEGRIRAVLDLGALIGGGEAAGRDGWLVFLGGALKTALRVDDLPVAVDVEPLADEQSGRAQVLDGEFQDKVLVMLSAGELLALIHPSSHGAVAP